VLTASSLCGLHDHIAEKLAVLYPYYYSCEGELHWKNLGEVILLCTAVSTTGMEIDIFA
jgi:hypothetical protein